jgi:hypothetical protein
MHAIRDIRFEFNYSGSQFWFFQWLSLANPVLPTEITICRFADEWGCSPPPTPPCSAVPDFKDYPKKSESEFTPFKLVTTNHVCCLLSQLAGNKATGLDKISSKVVKIAAPVISDSLTYIFNQSIILCTFPNEWKVARIIPLFKNGKRNLAGNYRPISVLPACHKQSYGTYFI